MRVGWGETKGMGREGWRQGQKKGEGIERRGGIGRGGERDK